MDNVDREKWEQGQIQEKAYHTFGLLDGYEHHRRFYEGYFQYLQIDKNINDRKILEIGPANFPLLGYCMGTKNCTVIEPMESDFLKFICELKEITIIQEIAEESFMPESDEIWLCNVLQHVINPDVIINRCKEHAQIIRFFEPINTALDVMHHWSFGIDYFKEHFGEAKLYPRNMDEPYFHKWENAYGIYIKK